MVLENKHESHKKVCESKDLCNAGMPSKNTKILEFNQYQKSDKVPFIIYPDLECLIENIDGSKNNPGNSSTRKVSEYISSSFSKSTISSFKSIENKHAYRGKDCIKKFCKYLRERTMKIKKKKEKILKIKKMKLLTNQQQISHWHAKFCYIPKKIKINMLKIKIIVTLGTIVIIQVNIEMLHIEYVI